MTNLSLLKVSLTKHGAHKVAKLIKAFPRDQILQNTWETFEEIRIDTAQTASNLSVSRHGHIPEIWDEVRRFNKEYINDLVLIAIIFSHHKLIQTMISASTGKGIGVVERGAVIDAKEYTNFAHVLDELGFATTHTPQRVSFNLSRIFQKIDLIPLIVQLLTIKLKTARWDRKNDFIDECLALNFHKVFGVDESFFRNWLQRGVVEVQGENASPIEEIIEEEPEIKEILFKGGHTQRSEADVIIKKASPKLRSTLLHNKIQNKLYNILIKEYSEDLVGTEIDCGNGTIVDLVRKENSELIFYEIKTASSVRLCIRQALSQLLEYCYWPDRKLAKQLIIVSQNEITHQGKKYLNHLREKFNLPVYYQQFNLKNNELEELF